MKTASFGSISSGTHVTAELVDAFAGELQWLTQAGRNDRSDTESALLIEANNWSESGGEGDEAGTEILEALMDALQAYAPPYGYFGAHPGDGADFGFWLSELFTEDFDGLKVSDTSEVPADYAGEVLQVSDHGNLTLYAKDEGATELREIWALV